MDWTEIEFCPESVLKETELVPVLVGAECVFPEGLESVFLERYCVMRNNFMTSCLKHKEAWQQGNYKLADVTRYSDALLELPISAPIWNAEWMNILANPCVGHDLPIWMSGKKPICGRRVMIISQDPLRTGHGKGKLLLSTPFGFHSSDYRNERLMMKLAYELMFKYGCVLYLTDFMKVYNREPMEIKNGKISGDCRGCVHYAECMKSKSLIAGNKKNIKKNFIKRYKECLHEEIKLFNPNVVLILGRDAACSCFPCFTGFKSNPNMLKDKWNVDGTDFSCCIGYHPNRITAYRKALHLEKGTPIDQYLPYYIDGIVSGFKKSESNF